MFSNITKHFTRKDTIIFFISFCFGIFVVCVIQRKPDVIVRWPTPENAGLVKYVDRANNCYEYETKEVGCTDDAKHIPIQAGNDEGMTVTSPINKRYTDKPIKIIKQLNSWENSFV
jgi:hypothetical protein